MKVSVPGKFNKHNLDNWMIKIRINKKILLPLLIKPMFRHNWSIQALPGEEDYDVISRCVFSLPSVFYNEKVLWPGYVLMLVCIFRCDGIYIAYMMLASLVSEDFSLLSVKSRILWNFCLKYGVDLFVSTCNTFLSKCCNGSVTLSVRDATL